jgi:hypothetical protein
MKFGLFLSLLSLIPSLALAQVNTEQYRSGEEEGRTTILEIDFGLKKGNVDLLSAGLDLGSSWQGEQSSLLLIGDGSFASKRTLSDYAESPDTGLIDADAHYINKILSHLRYNRSLSERVMLELFGQVERNEFLLMDRRLLGGLGPRFQLLESESANLVLGLAYMLEHERLDEFSIHPTQQDRDTLAHRATSYLSGSLAIGESSALGGTVYIQPRLTDPADFRALGEIQLSVGINEALALGVEFLFRHDSLPPVVAVGEPAMAETDLSLGQSLTLSF